MGKKIVYLITIMICYILSTTVKGETLIDVVKNIGTLSPKTIRKKIEQLPQEEQIKLRILLLSYAQKDNQARNLINKLYPEKVVSNVLLLPNSQNAIVVDKTNEKLYIINMNNRIIRTII
jgi:hypothetical protein